MITQDQYNALFQNARELHVKISILNKTGRKINEIQGVTTGGSIRVDGNSTIRRTCNVDLIITDSSFSISSDSSIWLDKKIQISIGLMDYIQDEVVWFDMGKYIINQPSVRFGSTEHTLSFEGLDLMCMFNGDRNGKLINKVIINAGTPLHEAIKMTVKTLGGHDKVLIESSDRLIPMDITKDAGSSIWDLLSELQNLYMDMECFFDLDGTFIYQKIRRSTSDPVIWDFTQTPIDLTTDYTINYDFSNVKNKIVVNGAVLENGIQVKYIAENSNPESPFNINSEIGIVADSYDDSKIYTDEQAIARGNYQLWQNSNLKELIGIGTVPIYGLDVNKITYLKNEDVNIEGRYLITDFNIPLDVGGSMSVNITKLYDN